MYVPPSDTNGLTPNTNKSIEASQEIRKWGPHQVENLTDSPPMEISSLYQSSQKNLDESFENFMEKELKQNFIAFPQLDAIDRTDSIFESTLFEGTSSNSLEEDIFGGDSNDIFGDNSNDIDFDFLAKEKETNIEEQIIGSEELETGASEQKIGSEEEHSGTQLKEFTEEKKEVTNIKAQMVDSNIVEFNEAKKTELEKLKNLDAPAAYVEGFETALIQSGITVKDQNYIRIEVGKELGPSRKILSEEDSAALGEKIFIKGFKKNLFQKNGRPLTQKQAQQLLITFNQNFRIYYRKKIKPFFLLQQKELKEKEKINEEKILNAPLPEISDVKQKKVSVSHLSDDTPFIAKMEKVLERKLEEAAALAERLKEAKIEREEINYLRLRHVIVSKEINHTETSSSETNKENLHQQNLKINNLGQSRMVEHPKKTAIEMKAKS